MPIPVVSLLLTAASLLGEAAIADPEPALRGPFGGPRASRHWARSRTFDLRHVRIDLELDWEAREILAQASLVLEPLRDGLTRVELDAAELDVQRASLADGTELEHELRGDRLEIRLDRAYGRGEPLTTVVGYRARPRKGLYFVGPDDGYPDRPTQVWTQGETEDTRYWIPVYDFPNDKATSEVVATVPEDMTAVSNGRLKEVVHDAAARNRIFHWSQETPHSTYLISLVVGRFDRHVTSTGDVPIEHYVPAGTDEAVVTRSFGATADMMRFFSEYIGIDYPWDKYAHTTVEEFLWGGMENTSASTLTSDTLHGEPAEPNFTSEGLVAHELAHQWWGDLVTCRDWSEVWLNEGFATFFTHLWFEHRYGKDRYDYRRHQSLEEYLEEERAEYRRPLVWSVYVDALDLFDDHAYDKGALFLAMLRGHLGEADFRRVLKVFGTAHAGGNVTTADLRRAVAETTGRELDRLFEQWVYRAGHPEFHVTSEWSRRDRQLHLVVEQRQKLHELGSVFRLPIDVEVATARGSRRWRIEIDGARGDYYLELAERPRWVRFDPDHLVPKTLEFPKPVEELVDLLRNDPSVIGRIWAARELSKRVETRKAAKALKHSIENEPFHGVRAEIASALGKTRSPAARGLLIGALGDADARVREEVAKALGRFRGDRRAADALMRTIRDDGKDYVVGAALEALGKTRDGRAFGILREALGRDSHRDVVRAGALAGLGKLGDGEALPLLLEWTRYGRPGHARRAAVKALPRLGRRRAEVLERLADLLRDPQVHVRRLAARSLGKLADPEAIEALEEAAGLELERRVRREIEASLDALREGREEPDDDEEEDDDENGEAALLLRS